MSQDNNNMMHNHIGNTSESIDLIDLIIQLWKEKVTIITIIVVMVILAGVYLLVAKEKWVSTAVITQPDAAQIATYNTALNVIYGKTAPNISDVQQRAIERFSASLSALSETLDNQEKPEKLMIDSSVKGQPLPLQVTYVGDSAENAKNKLAQYIQQVDSEIGEELAVDLKDNIKLQIRTLNDSLDTQEKMAIEKKTLHIKQISEALKFANEAKITTPQIQQAADVTQDTMFLLGSEGLASMIKNEATRPLVFPFDYYQTKKNLFDIQALKIDPKTIHAYRYVMKPTLPLRRDSPKKGITLILGALIGLILGSGVVLGRNTIRSYKPVS